MLGVTGDDTMTPDRSRRAARAGVLLVPLLAAALTACGDDGPDVASTGSEPPATSASGAPGTSAPGTSAPATSAPGTSAAGTTGGEGGDVSADDLDGRTFVATESTGHELVEDADVVIQFADGSVSGTGGCNSFIATPYSIDGDELVVDGPMGMTEMACEPAALMDQDTWLAELLTGGPTIELDGDTLTLTSDDDTVTFTDREVTDPDQELTGTTWELDSIVSADAVSSVPTGVRTPTMVIDGDAVMIDTGCNTARGGVAVGDGTIEFEPLATTRMACPGDASDVEGQVLVVLDGTVDYGIDADQLTIMNGDDGLVFRAAG